MIGIGPNGDPPAGACRRRPGTATLAAALVLGLIAGCGLARELPPNPFRTTPVIAVSPTPTAVELPPEPTATPIPFRPYWVKNHRVAEMWSGQVRQSGVVSFGETSQQFCVFRVEQPQDGPRLYVLNPYSGGHFWIDADAVGPISAEPPRLPGPKPTDENCAEAIYAD